MVVAGFMVIGLLALIAMIYSLISGSTLSKPHVLLALALVTCGAASLVLVVLDGMHLLTGQKENDPLIKLLIQFASLSIASLGGGLLGGAFMQKAQIAHKLDLRRMIEARDALRDLLEQNQQQIRELQGRQERSPEDQRLLDDLIQITVKWQSEIRSMSEEIERRQSV
ncbi:hypothetical protein [Algiphilus sp.]|uniref:hypothetical protein n=1 Tax=Algiphilus sp. TaxID=1872431 RepID=UPI0032EAF0CE